MNVELMERVITRILSDEGYQGRREVFDMANWIVVAEDDGEVNVCETTCCLAGEAILLDLQGGGVSYIEAVKALHRLSMARYTDIPARAAAVLALPPPHPSQLVFYRPRWPVYYQDLAAEGCDLADPGWGRTPFYNGEAVAAAALLRDMIDGRVVLDTYDDDGLYWEAFTANAELEVEP